MRPRFFYFYRSLLSYCTKSKFVATISGVVTGQMGSETEHIAVTKFRQYLQINTQHPNPDYSSCTKFLKSYAAELDLDCKVIEPHVNHPFVLMTWPGRDTSLPSLLLYSHTDVVPVCAESWTYDPFSAHKDQQGNIFARGSQDMKCIGVQYLEAIRKLRSAGARCLRTIHVLFAPDEEIDGEAGMSSFVDHEEFRKLNHGFSLDEGMASEDDTYRVYYAERRPWSLKVTCRGNPGHGSKFIENTAAEKLCKVVNSFLDFREVERKKLLNDSQLTLGDVTTVNLTKIEGGVQINVVPAEISAYFDIRIPPTVDANAFLAQIEGWFNDAGPDVTYEWVCKVSEVCVTDTSADNVWWTTFTKVMDQLKLKYKKEIFPASTDSGYLRAVRKKFPALNFSPIINTPQLLHDHNEFLNENVFLTGLDIYTTLLSELANVQPL